MRSGLQHQFDSGIEAGEVSTVSKETRYNRSLWELRMIKAASYRHGRGGFSTISRFLTDPLADSAETSRSRGPATVDISQRPREEARVFRI